MRKLATPQHLAAYQAVVPGAAFDSAPFDPTTAGAFITLSNGNRDIVAATTAAAQQSCVLSTTPVPVNTAACWEYEVLAAPPPGFEQVIIAGAYYTGATPMPPYNALNAQGGQNGQGVLAFFRVEFPDSLGFSLLTCAVTPGPAIIPAIAVGDVLGYVMDSAGTQMYFFRNGALVSGGPLALDPTATDMTPLVGFLTLAQ